MEWELDKINLDEHYLDKKIGVDLGEGTDFTGICVFDPNRTIKFIPMDVKEPNSFISTHLQDELKKELLEKIDRLQEIENDKKIKEYIEILHQKGDIDFTTIVEARRRGRSYALKLLEEYRNLKNEVMEIVEKLNYTFEITWN